MRPPSLSTKKSMFLTLLFLSIMLADPWFRSLTLSKVLDLEAEVSEDDSAQSSRGSDNYLATDDDGDVGYQ